MFDFTMNWVWCCFFLLHGADSALRGKCQEDEFMCNTALGTSDNNLVECIPTQYLCDSVDDCSDSSDELDCSYIGASAVGGLRMILSLYCLTRHDIYGKNYEDYELRSITEKGQICSNSSCQAHLGYGIFCSVMEEKQYCHVPFCGFGSLDYRLTCDFTISTCGWNVRSNATFRKWISEQEGLMIKVHVKEYERHKTIITSPVNAIDSYDYMIEFSIRTTKNVTWSLSESDSMHGIYEWSNRNCTNCHIDIEANFRITLVLWVYGFSEDEFLLSISRSYPHLVEGRFLSQPDCKWNEYKCFDKCKPASVLYDGVNDCGYDEEILNDKCSSGGLHEEFQCSNGEIKCISGSCLPQTVPSSLISKCLRSNTTLPYHNSSTRCPSDYICKQQDIFARVICLREEEICDGIPHCPHLDDEVGCPESYCPSGCFVCTNDTYRCNPRVISNIPSQASSIDVSGYPLNMSNICSFTRLKLLSLNLSNSNIRDISCLSFAFPNLINLDVSNNYLMYPYINPGRGFTIILDGNPVLELRFPCVEPIIQKISLAHSNVTKVVFGFHSNVHNSSFLFLRDSHDLNLPHKVYCFLSNIDLSDNHIESTRFLSDCYYLKFLDLSRNYIRNLTNVIWLRHIVQLVLSDNLVSNISAKALSRMVDIKVLDLRRNRIDNIAPDAFQNNRNLRELYLSNNQLKHLNLILFSNLTNLEILALGDNFIEELQTGIFKDLESLKTLHINHNNLTYISRGVFGSLCLLKYLDIRGNGIAVTKDIFFGLSNLHSLLVDKWSLCCVRPKTVSFENCQAPKISISSCSYLLQSGYMSIYLWYIVLFIFYGTLTHIYHQGRNGFRSCLTNISVHMSVAHLIVCLSIFGLLLKDTASKGHYGLSHDEWKEIWQCNLIRVLSAVGMEATMIISSVIGMKKLFSSRQSCIGKRIDVISISFCWIYSITVVFVYFVLRTFYSTISSTFEQVCVLMPMYYRNGDDDADSLWTRIWLYVLLITHSISFVGIVAIQIDLMKKHGSFFLEWRKIKDPLMRSAVNVAIRDFIMCAIVYVQMVTVIPEAFSEIMLCIIPTFTALHTLIMTLLKTKKILEVKEIIPCSTSTKALLKEDQNMKLFIVFDPTLKKELTTILSAEEIVIVYSDGSGWKRTSSNFKAIRNILICGVPTYGGNVMNDCVDIDIKIWNKTKNSCIGRGSIQIDVSQTETTRF